MTKKRTIGCIVAGLMAALMIGLVTPAFADDPPTTSNLYIHKYILTDIKDVGSKGTGSATDPVPADAMKVDGVAFDVFRVTSGTPAAGKVYSVIGTTLYVTEADGTALSNHTLTKVGQVTTGTTGDGTALMPNLPHGMYVVVENYTDSSPVDLTGKVVTINLGCSPFIVGIPMTNAAGTGYLTDIHVFPKNEALIVTKEVGIPDGEAVGVGSLVPYTITTSIPDGIEKSKQYNVVDQLDSALDLVSSSVTVTTVPAHATGLVSGVDYNLTYTTGRLMTISFTNAGRAKLQDYTSVKVAFNVTVNASILDKIDLTVANEAELDFTNENDVNFRAGTGGRGPRIHTAAIKITKVDQNGIALNGATFKIATSEANALAGRFLRIDSVDSRLFDYGTTDWTRLNTAGDYTITANNVASFVGLKDRVSGTWQSYWVVEVVAPAGYNMISAPIKVDFNGAETAYTKQISVTNNKGFTLPETGGLGTILFVVGGIILLGAAVLVIIAPRRKRKSVMD